jgi:hypothetical protein
MRIREPVDFGPFSAHPDSMSKAKKPGTKAREKKTPGTIMVEKYRPKMNKLSDAERQKLLVCR